ncbi:MAG TPA: hypothetical protein VGV37_02480 [Aliidongia sp.]|uniref:hypothetical protein n=1 Tax=Aliidongia sp. TaxID=1914230 RepID=UPI002DDCFF51|nr:hypothetical protein [Aliidongia sp.]HEV2673377.1 hypothetical protein [Aliidongia sp.]
MPNVPTFDRSELPQVQQTGGQVNPAAAAAPEEALMQGAGQFENTVQEFNQRYQDARRQADTAGVMADATTQLADAQFRWSKVADRQTAMTGYAAEAQQIRAANLARINDPLATQIFSGTFDHQAAAYGVATGQEAFGLESSKRVADLDLRLSQYAQAAVTAPNDQARASIIGQANGDISGTVAGGWLHPEAGAQALMGFRSKMAEVSARQDMNSDPGAAAEKLQDPTSYPYLDPNLRQTLQYRADMRADRLERLQIAGQAHADAMAAKDQRQAQSSNETNLLEAVYSGKDVDPNLIAHLAETQQISPGGLEAVHSAMARKAAGTDDPMAVVHAYDQLGKGNLTSDNVTSLIGNGSVKGTTGAELMRAVVEQGKQQTNATERGYYGQLKTALSGGAVEQGLFKDTPPIVERWGQAQGEWTQRVLVSKEDPQAVLSDMLPRYAGSTATSPSWLPAPRFGAIGNTDDLTNIAVKTNQAFQAGQIDQPTYDGQVNLLNQYKSFYDQQNAARTVTAKPKPGAKPTEGGQ